MTKTFITRRAVSAGIAAFALLTVAAACGGSEDGGEDSTTSNETAEFNDADVTFAQMMIPHHEQALEMAAMAEEHAEDSAVLELAGQIAAAQQPEIDTLTGLLEEWGESTDMGDHGGHAMPGMMSDDEMGALGAAHGADFDMLFAHHMIAHHQGAIEMAETEIADGENAEAIALAEEVVAAQAAEIAILEGMMGDM